MEKEEKDILIPSLGDLEELSDPLQIIKEAKEYMKIHHSDLLCFDCTDADNSVDEELEDSDEDLEELGNQESKLQGDGFWRSTKKELQAKERSILKEMPDFDDVAVDGPDIKIHTVSYMSEAESVDGSDGPTPKVPLVMIHGLGGSTLAFHKNYEELSEDRDVYGIDLPGFGLSSRKVKFPSTRNKFPNNPDKALALAKKCEDRMVQLIENWRKKMNLDKMILLGHSFGGFIAAVYAMKYEKHVRHLVLVDPWGMFTEEECKELDSASIAWKRNSMLEGLAMRLSKPWRLNPLDISRAGGNVIGVLIMKVMLPDSQQEAYGDETMKYFVAVNSQKPTGEKLFSVLSGYDYIFPMPSNSLKSKLLKQEDYPVMTIIYGKCSRFRNPGVNLLQEMPRVTVEEVDGASHHVHAENTEEFHKLMRKVFCTADAGKVKDIEAHKQS